MPLRKIDALEEGVMSSRSIHLKKSSAIVSKKGDVSHSIEETMLEGKDCMLVENIVIDGLSVNCDEWGCCVLDEIKWELYVSRRR